MSDMLTIIDVIKNRKGESIKGSAVRYLRAALLIKGVLTDVIRFNKDKVILRHCDRNGDVYFDEGGVFTPELTAELRKQTHVPLMDYEY